MMTRVLGAGFLVAAVAVPAAAWAVDGVVRIVDRGRDGDINYYEVSCENGSVGTVTQYSDRICAQPLGGKEICVAGTAGLVAASVQACKAK